MLTAIVKLRKSIFFTSNSISQLISDLFIHAISTKGEDEQQAISQFFTITKFNSERAIYTKMKSFRILEKSKK